jgi:hypothetical protein
MADDMVTPGNDADFSKLIGVIGPFEANNSTSSKT